MMSDEAWDDSDYPDYEEWNKEELIEEIKKLNGRINELEDKELEKE